MNEEKQDATVSSEEPAGKGGAVTKSRWPRRLLLLAGLLLVLVVVLVLLLPTLLSTNAGKGFIFGAVSDGIAGKVEVDTLSLGWFGGQSMSGLVVRGEDGAQVARVGRIDLPDATLFGLLSGGLTIGEARIESVSGDIVGYEDGTTNLQRALASRGGKAKSKKQPSTGSGGGGPITWPEGLSFSMVLRDVDVTYRAHDVTDPIRLIVKEADLAGADPTQLLFKLNAEVSQADRKGSVVADAQIDGLFDGSGLYQPDAASAQIATVVTDLPTEFLDSLMEQGGKLTALLGPVVNGEIKGEAGTSGGTATLTFVSEHMDIDGGVAFNEGGVVGVGTSHVRLTVTPDAWALLSATGDKPASTLAGPVGVAVELTEFELPINDAGLVLADARVGLKMTVGETGLRIDKVGTVELKNTTGMIQSDGLGSLLTGRFTTTSAVNGKPGGVSLDIELSDLIDQTQQVNLSGLSAKVNGKLTNAPVAAVLDELMPATTHGLATKALGPTIDADINLTTAPKADGDGVSGSFNVDLLTTGGEAGLLSALIGRFSAGGQEAHFDLADGSYVKFDLTPDLIEAYQSAFPNADADDAEPNPGRITLAEPATLRLSLSEVYGKLVKGDDGAYAFDPPSARFKGRINSPQMKLNQQNKSVATLSKLLMDIQSEGLSSDTRVVMNAKVEYPTSNTDDAARPGLIESATNISGLMNSQGEIDSTTASYQTVTKVQQAPIDLIDALFGMEGELVAAVGPRALLNVVGSYTPSADSGATPETAARTQGSGTGGFDLLLKSRTASADMKLLVEEGKWTLKADAPLSFQVTPTLSQAVLKKVNPFLGGAVSAKLPIGVTIKQERFSVPISDPAIGDVNADINLVLGELDLRGEGQFRKLLEQLGVGDRSLVNVGFTPVAINLTGGKLSYKDFVMTVGDVALGFSGVVNLNNETLDLKMTIPGTSLANIKWLKGAVKPDHVIVIPLGGTFDQPTLDFKLLSGEIAKAALKGQLEGVAGDAIGDKIGPEAGAVVGGILNDLLSGKKQGAGTVVPESTGQETAPTDPAPQTVDTEPPSPAAQPELTPQELAERKERRRLRRERLEREQAEQDKQTQ